MSLLDFFTGGKSDEAIDALKRAEGYFGAVKTPTVEQLTLPELQKYVEAGVLTPAQAKAYLQESNAFNDMNVNQTGTAAQIQALNQLAGVANAEPEGTPMQQAQMENSIQKMNTAAGGQRGAIEQAMAAKGTPAALIQAALSNQTVGQEAQQAHMDAVNAQAAAYQTALNAMAQGGALGGQLQGQQNAQANQVAAAQNAMQQFNAANQQNVAEANANRTQEANANNWQNRQNISNNNVGLSNARTQYNAGLPQQVFNNQLNKAAGQAGAATNIGEMQQKQGQQNAGIWAGLINTGTSFIPRPGGASSTFMPRNPTEANFNSQYQTGGYAHGGVVNPVPAHYDCGHPQCMARGGICMEKGGMIPGQAPLPGDSVANDLIDIHASPGEAVIPRTAVASHPSEVMSLIQGHQPEPEVDPHDVATLLKALRSMRLGVA